MTYWPWWAGSLALGTVAVGYARLTGRLFGVSGILAKAAHPTAGRASDAIVRSFAADPAALEAALLAATAAEFPHRAERTDAARATRAADTRLAVASPVPWIGHVVFLAMVSVGALLASLARGTFRVQLGLGPEHEHLVASGLRALPALAVGGLLVGAGTRMAGGCTSGHGLSGAGRLVPASLAATAIFFGVGAAVSMALNAGAR